MNWKPSVLPKWRGWRLRSHARVTKRQGLIQPEVLTDNLAEAMKRVVKSADVRVAINPAQRKTLDAAPPRLAMQWPALEHVKVIEDAGIAPGGCRILTENGLVDADLDTQLNRIAEELLPEAAATGDQAGAV